HHIVRNNHIYRTTRGIWLDWMTQGTRVTRNLLHDNGPSEDLFVEVNHGPFLVDNNILLSGNGILVNSQGAAYVHNLIAGRVHVLVGERRLTPHLEAHATDVAGLAPNPSGDERYYNNIFVNGGLAAYDNTTLPVFMDGNLFLNGAQPCKHETNAFVLPKIDLGLKLEEKSDGRYLQMKSRKTWADRERPLVTTEMLGRAKTPNLPYEDPEGQP
ncbi:MAG: xylosidase, partial [bacterium]|nr:xylosidase [bacterium]